MTEEAKFCVKSCRDWYQAFANHGQGEERPVKELLTTADLIESLYAQLEQVTRERDALQVEIDVLNEEYYAGIHTIRPAVDAEPVRHGYWIPQDNTYTKFMCSDCKGRNHDSSGKYCSECGCKMDVEVEG